jgi:hypothetical protein
MLQQGKRGLDPWQRRAEPSTALLCEPPEPPSLLPSPALAAGTTEQLSNPPSRFTVLLSINPTSLLHHPIRLCFARFNCCKLSVVFLSVHSDSRRTVSLHPLRTLNPIHNLYGVTTNANCAFILRCYTSSAPRLNLCFVESCRHACNLR